MDGATTPSFRPTVADLTGDNHFAQLAKTTWLTKSKPGKVVASTVKGDIWDPLENEAFSYSTLLLLEQLQTLERYLWPGYTDESSDHHVLLLVLLTNVKKREGLPVWNAFGERPDAFSSFFRRVLHISIDQSLSTALQSHILTFIVGAFQSLENGLVRKECAPLVSIGIWEHMHSERAREQQLAKSMQLQKAWRAAQRRYDGADASALARLRFERSWLYTLVLGFLNKLYNVDSDATQKAENMLYCERFLELLCDMESQMPTRRYVNTLLRDLNIMPAGRLAPLYIDEDSGLLRDMYQLLGHYVSFPVDDQSMNQLSEQAYDEEHNAAIGRLQKIALKLHPEKLKILVLANNGSLGQRDELEGHLAELTDAEVTEICQHLNLRTDYPEGSLVVRDRAFLNETMMSLLERKPLFTNAMQSVSVLPTERTIYEQTLLRTDSYDGARPLALPKLNLYYLTISDFLWRSFVLYRSEAFYEIRQHVEDTIKRLRPRRGGAHIQWDGFSRMAIPISKPAIIDTVPPRIGEQSLAEVKVEVILDVSKLQPGLRREWESLKPDDVVYLLAVQPSETSRKFTNGHNGPQGEAEKLGLQALRCAEVISVLDEQGRVLRYNQGAQGDGEGFARPRQRRLLLRLDAASYRQDKERADKGQGDIYDNVNLIVRRRARENNFKSVLESIRQLTTSDVPAPEWLKDVFLGFGDPASASYKRLPNRLTKTDYRDTFLDWQHLIASLPGKTVEPDPNADAVFPPPYVLEQTVAEQEPAQRPAKKRRRDQIDGKEAAQQAPETFRVSTYKPENSGPYPADAPKLNTIRFTPAQVEAITSGTQPGLTVVVGPPGTGKTDVATQIISNIYHNFPQQRTLLIAHSNQALNQLFQKIVALDIDQTHLLRLGHGEEELQTEASFSKAGRVESFLERGAAYLQEVYRLAASIGAVGSHHNSCETADYFNQVWIQPRWTRYWDEINAGASKDQIITLFPFHYFFSDTPRPLFPDEASREECADIAKGCENHIRRIFSELAEIRPFEILRTARDKANYLLTKEARIVAMTSTHAAMRRQEIATLGFHYDTVIMEEAAQTTEIENFIPLALQNPTPSDKQHTAPTNRLQRIVLVGDHLQNSPVIPNAAFRSYANLEQSLFRRLIRLGVPHTVLDVQGRARPSLAQLYQWRYPKLSNLPSTLTALEFVRANAGFKHEYQFIDVPDYRGQGETEPSPHFIQNLGEAEYAVALYMYMRLLGYPAHRITLLTTYAGQRALIRDVLTTRCKNNPLFGMPGWVGTVDKYQGEQNDYVILSLVRTKTPGYMRDLRRLTVMLSRARLGLYVLGRREVFETSLELREPFRLLFERSNSLELVTGEMFSSEAVEGERGVSDEVQGTVMEGVEHLGQYVVEITRAKVQALKEGKESLEVSGSGAGVAGRIEDEDIDEEMEEAGEDDEGLAEAMDVEEADGGLA
ncbi:hypothetical protein MBLNU230_g3355t1 [Neophaeotheca triangularis]